MIKPTYDELLELCKDTWTMLEYGANSIDFSNGNVYNGMDEGDVLGWQFYAKLQEKVKKWRILSS